jgi:glycosyltransferase involved in cell wall biosynthesis
MQLSIVIPAYNEQEAIAAIIESCLAAQKAIVEQTPLTQVEIIVVSDGSSDDTEQIARSYQPQIHVIAYPDNRGYGAALKTGFAAAHGELVSFLDADGTCDPLYFVPMVNKLTEENADIAIGSRMGPDSEMPAVRRLGNRIFRGIINWLGRAQITDAASGMRVIRADRLPDIYPLPDGLHFTPAMTCRAVLDLHLSIVEVPMTYKERVGRSKLNAFVDGLRFARAIGRIALTYRPLRFLGIPGLLLVLVALFYGVCLLSWYVVHREIADWLIYRMAAVTAFGTAGVNLVLIGLLAERTAALLNRQERNYRGRWLLERLTRAPCLIVLALVLIVAALVANWGGIVQYVTTGQVTIHWSFVIFGLFAIVQATLLAGFVVLDHLLELFRENAQALDSDLRSNEMSR